MKTKIVEVQVPAILSVTVRVPEDATEEELYEVLTCIPAEEMEVKKWSDVDWIEVDIEEYPMYFDERRLQGAVLDYTEGFLLARHEELHAEAQAKLDFLDFSRAELDAFIVSMTDKGIPVCVNVPEELIRYIPDYIRHRFTFVTCNEAPDLVINTTGLPLSNEASDLVINTTLGSLKDLI